VQPRKGQKEHYINRNDNVRQESQSNVWISRLRPRTKPTIPGNLTGKTQREAEFQIKQCQNKFLGRNSTNSLLYCIYFY
jgi:hypothetical protein